ncbi:MAG: hypothetical protein EZS28_024640 [Streblomastix strix]|uniref:Reverse transcriptase domain-containing protein n=1 Tax=Streblomastix strix TaxID=222440 RepID=A0A5J4VBD7_9EUKA|nr:MAG: hypothetical protein EZS28_024640 [Streblomastix strix]
MNKTDQVRDLIRKGDWATSLDLKSAFHNQIVYPTHRPYLAFEVTGKVYQYRAMPYGTQHCPKLHRTSTSNGSNENSERIRYKNIEFRGRSAPPPFEQRNIERINFDKNENFGSFLKNNCPRKMRNRAKTISQLPRINLYLEKDALKDGISKKIRTIFLIKEIFQFNRETSPFNVKYLASIMGKLNFQRAQVREDSLYQKLVGSTKTGALKNKEWKENMILPKKIIYELYRWQGVIVRNQEMTLEMRNLVAVMVPGVSPKGRGVTLELQTGDTLVQHGEWNKEQKRRTSNKKEMEAIYLKQIGYRQIFTELQIKAILIKSDSSTAV